MTKSRRFSFTTMKSRIIIALVAWLCVLAVLGGYAISLTVAGGLDLAAVRTLHEQLYTPIDKLTTALQEERRLSMVFVGSGRSAGRDDLTRQRKISLAAESELRRQATGSDVQDEAGDTLKERIRAALDQLSTLDGGRSGIDSGRADQTATMALFSGAIDAAFVIYDTMPVNRLSEVSDSFRSLVALGRARELLAQEIATLTGALAAGQLSADQRQSFAQLMGAQRYLFTQAAANLDPTERTRYDQLTGGTSFTQLRGFEDAIAGMAPGQARIPVSADDWTTTGSTVLTGLRGLESSFAAEIPTRSDAAANSTFIQAGIIILIGLLFVILLMTVWLRVAPRHVQSQLTGLKQAALDLAEKRLPRVVEQLRHGEEVDVNAVAPPLEFGPDEFGDVGRAFNAVQHTAVKAAVDEAALRNSIKDVFVNLARRSQSLVQRQLSMLDDMERRTNDPEELAKLFAIDHLATRMRRHSEDLIILSGAPPARRWRQPVPLMDVVRGAVGEVENYGRVMILPIQQAALSGRVVSDVIHLLAELIENATSFSPPDTVVQVGGQWVATGFVIEIEDRGLGISKEDLDRFNQRLTDPPDFTLSDTRQLGLFVVGRLAERHGIKVHLRDSPYGGTTAVTLVPPSLMVTAEGEDPTAHAIATQQQPAPKQKTSERLVPQPIGLRIAGPLSADDQDMAPAPSAWEWHRRRTGNPTGQARERDPGQDRTGATRWVRPRTSGDGQG